MTDKQANWRPSATIETLQTRALLLERIRAFFAQRQILEVETPALSLCASTELHLSSWQVTTAHNAQPNYYLHTSPELFMKRLLAAGSGDIYQICKVYREGELGKWHNPEFTLLEWYRLGFDLQAMMQEVAELLSCLLENFPSAEPQVLTYQQAFETYAGCDPFGTDIQTFKQIFLDYTRQQVPGIGDTDWLDLIMSQVIEPQLPLDRLVFITHYPATQASLARLSAEDARLAERFEVFAGGLELANGFEELSDPVQQRQRIEQENRTRRAQNLPEMQVDENFLAALEHGLPPCSGVAVGFDRLVMLATGLRDIREVLGFAFDRV